VSQRSKNLSIVAIKVRGQGQITPTFNHFLWFIITPITTRLIVIYNIQPSYINFSSVVIEFLCGSHTLTHQQTPLKHKITLSVAQTHRSPGLLMRPEHSETKTKTEIRECETKIEIETEIKNLS